VPESVLVVVHTAALDVLLIRRADTEAGTDFWQSVTGSRDTPDEPLAQTAAREVLEETGLDAHARGCRLADWRLQNHYDIYPRWRARYAPGVTRNTEHVFGLCVPAGAPVRLNPREHTAFVWLPWRAAADRCFSPSNAEACLLLPRLAREARA
jgi:dATP pyrophosphohydrolase